MASRAKVREHWPELVRIEALENDVDEQEESMDKIAKAINERFDRIDRRQSKSLYALVAILGSLIMSLIMFIINLAVYR